MHLCYVVDDVVDDVVVVDDVAVDVVVDVVAVDVVVRWLPPLSAPDKQERRPQRVDHGRDPGREITFTF